MLALAGVNPDISNGVFVLGVIAGTFTTLSFIPQVYHIWKRRSARDISGTMFTAFSIGSFLWLLYGLETHSIPVAIANAVTLLLNLLVLVLKWRFRRGSTSSPIRLRVAERYG
jgi:MtN3 and saliva related transmembrane protein